MEQTNTTTSTSPKRSVGAKIGRGFAIFLLSIIMLVVLVLILIQTAPVQNFGRKKIVSFLENKLKTRVELNRLDIDFPKKLVLEGVYLEDRHKDTLLAGKQLKVDIDMFKLIKGEIQINEINLNGITAKIKRQLPDTTFNYQFIIDAFVTPSTTPAKKDTAALKMAINKIIVDKSRFVYLDVVTGNDVDVYLNHFDTRINTFDPTHLRYDVPTIVLNGVRGRVNQTRPMTIAAVNTNPDSTVKNETPSYFNFTNKETLVSDIDVSYRNDVSAMATRIQFKDLNLYPRSIDLKNSIVAVDKVELNGLNGNLSMGTTTDTKVVKITNQNEQEVALEYLPWRVTVNEIRLNNNNFKFDDNTKQPAPRGMDYAHLNLKDLTLHADNFLFHNDTIAANIVKGNMTEKSGFVLNKFQTDFQYTSHGASLQNILIQTPGSEIKRSAIISYPSLAAVQKQMGLLNMDINIDNSYIQVKDILTFVPALASQAAFRNQNSKLYITSRVKGSLTKLIIDKFQLNGLQNTSVDISGLVNNATNPKMVSGDLNIRKLNTSVGDILTFAPQLASQPAFKNPNNKLYANGRVRGNMSRVVIDRFQFKGFENTNLDISGVVSNATDPKNVNGDLNIRRMSTSRGDILTFAPAGSIPKTITIPQTMSLNGVVKGGMKSAYANLNLNTSLGNAKVDGTISNPTDKYNAKYNAKISTSGLNVGAITQQPQNVGAISASFTINGRGFDPEKANATVKGVVYSAQVQKYTYTNLTLDGSMAQQRFKVNAAMQDPNIHFALNAEGDMAGDMPGFIVNADIDSIKTQPLNLTPDAIVYHGKIQANFPQFNLDALNGDILVTNSLLVMNGQRIALDSVSVVASNVNNQQAIALKSDFANAQLQGQYKLQQLGDVFIEAIQPYYAINTTGKPVTVDPYNFTINASVVDHPTLHAFMPDLKTLEPVVINAKFSSSEGINAKVTSPRIVYGTNTIDNLTLDAVGTENALNIISNVAQISSGTSIALYGTNLNATLANNKISFGLSVKDKGLKTKYRLAGLLSQEANNNFSFSLRPDSLMLNYDPWSINADNLIRFGSTAVNANNFNLAKGDQHLIINSLNTDANSPLEVKFASFKLATLTAFAQTDTLLADGTLNGNIVLKDLLGQPNFTTDLTINNLAINKDTIGDVNAKVNNNTANVYATNVTITGRGNDVALTGNYYLKPQNNSNMDLNLAIRALQLSTIEGATMGSIRDAKGYIAGNVKIGGTAASPDIDGKINFNQTSFIATMLNNEFKIDNSAIVAIDNKGFRFDNFTIKDSANNSLVINGAANTANFINYQFDMSVRAKNFRGLNTTKKDNPLYYGKVYFNTNLNIKGTEAAPIVDGNVRINEDTRLTVVLPQAEPGVVDRQGVIEFVDMDAPGNDSLFQYAVAKYDSTFNKSAITGFDITADIEIVKEAVFNIVIDEGNGDFLNLQGQALLNGGIDPSGKITLTGNYVLDRGGYELSFNFIRRKFDMQKGSTITWTGEPTTANLDVTAVYVANTSAIDLVGDQLSDNERGYYMQKLPFQVRLMVKGELLKPDLTFDIALPTENNARVRSDIVETVNTRLEQLKQEPSELNKQVFALLLLNRFVGENPFQSSGGGFNAATYARQSVSKILTEQLNNLATDLIAGVDISFDVNSTEDYSTGSMQNRTDFNVALSKRLLNDRLKVTVGSNFELEGAQQASQNSSGAIGNIAVDYNLTKDGRFLLRAYSRNEYEGIIEGYVVETGVKFIMSVDYNKFREIFVQRKQRREAKKENREKEKETKQATTGNDSPAKDSTTVQFEKVPADKRKTTRATDNVSTDEN